MIKVNQIEKNYGKFHLNCTMEVPDGCVTGLIGENGAGKSTVFKAIENLIFLDGGSIEVFGKPHTELNAKDREQIAIVLSDATFSNVYTIKDVARIMGSVYPDFDKKKFMGLVERFRLPKNQKVKEFSTGMKAKLKLFLALCHKARLLILDEPTAGMDVVARDEDLTLLREYMEEDEHRSILISSHISGDLEGFCDEIYMIHEGKIILHEDTDQLLGTYGVLKMTEEQYRKIDHSHLLRRRKEIYGYSCLTDEIHYYAENYPGITVEKGSIDEIIMLMVKGEAV